MDLINELEIFIPENAEVKRIPVQSFPRSVIRQISLRFSGSQSVESIPEPPQGTWICPVVLRSKGQGVPSSPGSSRMKNLFSQLGTHVRNNPNPLRMSLVSHKAEAYHLLKNTVRGQRSSRGSQPYPPGRAPIGRQNSVIIYRGCVFLTIKNPNQENQEAPPTSSPLTTTNELQCKGKKAKQKVKHLENQDGEDQDGGNQDGVDQVSQAEGGNGVHQEVESSFAAHHQLPDQEVWLPEQEEGLPEQEEGLPEQEEGLPEQEEGLWVKDHEEEESSSVIGHDDPSERGGGASFTLQPSLFDFNALEQEEKIAEMKAMLHRKQAALKNMTSSR